MDILWKKLRVSYAILLALLIGFAIGASVVKFSSPELTADYNIKVINDRDYFPAVHTLLNSAQSSIHISMFSLTYYLDYPNSNVNILPTLNGFSIESDHDNLVNVYDTGGRIIYSELIPAGYKRVKLNLFSGVYLVKSGDYAHKLFIR